MAQKSKKSQKIKFMLLNVLTGSDLSIRRLAYMEIASQNPGPVVWLTGCVHGDEVGGIFIIQRIFKQLRKIPLLKGSVYAFPLMNPIGFETMSRAITLSSEDLNRSFPGKKEGTLAERIAWKIFSTISKTKPTIVLDIHNDWLNSIPYTLIDPYPGLKHKETWEKSKNFGINLGFPLIDESETTDELEGLKRSLSGSLILNDIPALTLEIGGSSALSAIAKGKDTQDGVKAIWDLLSSLGMVEPMPMEFNYQLPDNYKKKVLKYSHHPDASKSGIVKFLVKPGDIVKKDQPLAKIYNVFGKLQETIICLNDGLVLGHSDFSVAYPGAEIISYGII